MKASKCQSKVTQKPVYELFRFKVLGLPTSTISFPSILPRIETAEGFVLKTVGPETGGEVGFCFSACG